MSTRLLNRLNKLRARRSDPLRGVVMLKEASLRNAVTERALEAMSYIEESMQPIPHDYTKKTFDESDRVQNHLESAFASNGILASFDHQGSVTNDTHIKFHSDIDLLVATEKFVTVAPPLQVTMPYAGNPIQDLWEIRNSCSSTLTANFPKANVDASGPRSISISGGSLARKIDVVPCNWIHNVAFKNGQHHYRGIKILNTKTGSREENYPFLHNFLIDDLDGRVSGNLRRIIRLVKSLRSDADAAINISSYDIAGLCYAMGPSPLAGAQNGAALLGKFLVYCYKLLGDSQLQSQINVPNGTRQLVCSDGLNLSELTKLCEEGLTLLRQATDS